MRRITKIVVWVVSICALSPCFSQTQQAQSEFIFGINSNTSGWLIGGIILKKSIRVGKRAFRTYGVEILNIRHPQESKIRSYTGNFYIYGKTNYLYSLRLQYGRDIILFNKINQSGVEIKLCMAAGFTIGLLSPYYIQWQGSFNGDIKHQPYDPNNPSHSPSRILGPGFLLEGLGESIIKPGANCKVGFSFETGGQTSQIAGFEAGFFLDVFFEGTDMVAKGQKKAFFPALYITILYGRRK